MKIFILMLLTLISCTKSENSPKGVVEALILAFEEKNIDKEFLLSKTTGELRNDIVESDDGQWSDYFVGSKLGPFKINFQQENCRGSQCAITYVVKYKQNNDVSENSQIEVKKVATVLNIDGVWLVSEITNVKTHIENKNNLEIESSK